MNYKEKTIYKNKLIKKLKAITSKSCLLDDILYYLEHEDKISYDNPISQKKLDEMTEKYDNDCLIWGFRD